MLINYKPTGQNKWDVRVNGSKKGRIEKRRGSFVALLTRHVSLEVLDSVTSFVAERNAQLG
jgi:hypothetical protein